VGWSDQEHLAPDRLEVRRSIQLSYRRSRHLRYTTRIPYFRVEVTFKSRGSYRRVDALLGWRSRHQTLHCRMQMRGAEMVEFPGFSGQRF